MPPSDCQGRLETIRGSALRHSFLRLAMPCDYRTRTAFPVREDGWPQAQETGTFSTRQHPFRFFPRHVSICFCTEIFVFPNYPRFRSCEQD